MKLRASFLENEVELSNEYITTIEIENKQIFYKFVDTLNKYSKEEYEEEIFDSKIKIKLIIDYFNLDYNNKKTLNNITKLIKENIDEQKSVILNKYYNKLLDVYESILKEIDIPLTIDKDINIDSLIKLSNVAIILENHILKNLFALIDIMKNTKEYDAIILVNLKQYLSKEEIIEFYKYAIYNQIVVIMIDSQTYGPTINYEKKLIINDNLEEFML